MSGPTSINDTGVGICDANNNADGVAASNLGSKTAKGSILAVTGKLIARLVAFAATLVLARLLSPEDFGLVAIALMAFGFLDVMRGMGTGEALVYQQRYSQAESNSAFWICITTSVVLALFFILAAPAIAGYFDNESVTALIRVMGLLFVLEALAEVPAARAKRDLQFNVRACAEIGRALSKGLLSVALALAGFGVWSIVFGQLFGSLVGVLIYWRGIAWRPSWTFDVESARSMVSYGLVLICVGILAFAVTRLDQFVIASRLDVQQLGYFAMAFSLASMLISDLSETAGQATCSTFARVQNDTGELRQYYLDTLFWHSVFGVALGCGLYFTSSLLVEVLLAEKWLPIVGVLQALSVHAIFVTLANSATDVITATGRARFMIYMNLGWLVIGAPLIWMAAPHGLIAIGWTVAGLELIAMVIFWTIVCAILNHRLAEILGALKPAVYGGIAMMLVLLLTHRLITAVTSSSILALVVEVVAGAIVYISVVLFMRPQAWQQIKVLARR